MVALAPEHARQDNVDTRGDGGSAQTEFPADFLERTLLFKEAVAKREEILRHKWIESEKAGHDIGMDRATIDWSVRFGGAWQRWRREHRGDGER